MHARREVKRPQGGVKAQAKLAPGSSVCWKWISCSVISADGIIGKETICVPRCGFASCRQSTSSKQKRRNKKNKRGRSRRRRMYTCRCGVRSLSKLPASLARVTSHAAWLAADYHVIATTTIKHF